MGERSARPVLEASTEQAHRRSDAIEALARLADPAALPRLAYLRRRWWSAWSDRLAATAACAAMGATEALEELRKSLRSRRVEVRTYAAALAGQRGLAILAPELLALSARSRDPAREAAIEALLSTAPPHLELPFQIWAEDRELSPELRSAAQARRDPRR